MPAETKSIDLPAVVKGFFDQNQIPASSTFVIGVSGGADSMALTHALVKANYRIHIVHINYHQRAEESDQDEAFVVDFARRHGLMFTVYHYEDTEGGNFQNEARKFRYACFELERKKRNLDYTLTAHHQDDALETLFLNFLRGTSLGGIKGISSSRLRVMRPLIDVPSKAIRQYAEEHGIEWREDSSNKNYKYKRNFIRHKIMPLLEEADYRFRKSVDQTLKNLRSEFDYIRYSLNRDLNERLVKSGNVQKLPFDSVTDYPFLPLLLRHWLHPFGLNDPNEALQLKEKQTGSSIEIGVYTLVRERDAWVLVLPLSEARETQLVTTDTTEISLPVKLSFSVLNRSQVWRIDRNFSKAYLDFDKLTFPLKIRKWETGDKIKPLGMSGFKKISDLLTDEKVPNYQRNNIFVMISGDEIVWVIGLRISEDFKVGDDTKKIYFAEPF